MKNRRQEAVSQTWCPETSVSALPGVSLLRENRHRLNRVQSEETMPTLQRLRIFVASPGDVAKERDHASALAEELNRGVAAQAGFVLDLVRWETHVTPDMGRPQQIVFDQQGPIDIFVGIMWKRFGTPSGVAGSGTEEEFNQALASFQATGRPRMLCYFSSAPIEPPATVEAAEQLLKVAQFRSRVESAGLKATYTTDVGFKEMLREHLQQILLKEFAGRTPPLNKNLQSLLDLEKSRCEERNLPFHGPNLLFALLSSPNGLARRIFDQACPGKAEPLVEQLRNFVPEGGRPFSDFDWNSRKDIQTARLRAIEEGSTTIDARHLLLGLLETASETQKELQRALGKKAFSQLLRSVKDFGRVPTGTPWMRGKLDV